uniref:Receptor ligand binding region domain-containing protein n=1 Tax=Ditylenchus dipsaci TaxID=166011 RepID=A0A915DWB7_9BILA
MNNACYKLLFYVTLLNIAILWILGFLHGGLTLLGSVYCSHPDLIYITGCILSGLWLAESSAELCLVLNRCLSVLAPSIENVLFSGRRIFLWIGASLSFSIYWFVLKKPILFNAIYFTYVFNPYAGYIDDSADIYNSLLHSAWNMIMAFGLPLLYIVFCIVYFIKANVSVENKTMNKKEKMMLLQVLIISLLNFSACSVYIYMMYVIPSEFIMHFAQFCWLFIHSLPPWCYYYPMKCPVNGSVHLNHVSRSWPKIAFSTRIRGGVPLYFYCLIVCLILFSYPSFIGSAMQGTSSNLLAPLRGAVFLPHDTALLTPLNEEQERHLATVDSVMPIIDVAIEDAHRLILYRWWRQDWLRIYVAPVLQCDDQKRAAWAALEALEWTNGSGLDVSFGPACDYVLATITRILSFHAVPMFTNAGFSEFFQVKSSSLLTRVGPLQEHVSMALEKMFLQFNWTKSQLLYEKTFWKSELHEAGFCKLLMNGLYLRSVEKRWPLKMDARIVPSSPQSSDKRTILKNYLIDAVGVNNAERKESCKKQTIKYIASIHPPIHPASFSINQPSNYTSKHQSKASTSSRNQKASSAAAFKYPLPTSKVHFKPSNQHKHPAKSVLLTLLVFLPAILASPNISGGQRHRWRMPFAEANSVVHGSAEGSSLASHHFNPFSAGVLPKKFKFQVSESNPIHILFPLPKESGRKEVNPFDITIDLAVPVVEEAVNEVYRRQLVPMNSLKTHFEDSKLSDAHGPNVAINALVNNELDCIIGYAFVYALAPVARMSPYWRDKDSVGIPVITSVGLTSNLDNRNEYKLMTRISSPYKVIKDAVLALFRGMEWRMAAYVFHDQKHDTTNPSLPYGECYLLMASLQPHLYKYNRMEHNYYIFNELNFNHERMRENLRKASLHANGRLNHSNKLTVCQT